jgi:uncharacterized Fe-S center protein
VASEVFFCDLRARGPEENTSSKIRRLFDRAGFAGLITAGDLAAIKLHFGELGSDAFVSPVFVRQVVEKVGEAGGRPFLTDTATLYTGTRHNAVEHLRTAVRHGFGSAVTGAPVIMADGLVGTHYRDVDVGLRHFSRVKIAGDILDAGSMIVISHFKGHGLAGFGGAIKNLAMGCAPPAGKRDQHAGLQPSVDRDTCIACEKCVAACPEGATRIEDGAAVVNRSRCIGCGECITVCPSSAITFDWEEDVPRFLEMMAEYALGAVAGKTGRVGYLNFLIRITPDCDCVPWSDAPIVPDIGILASRDPVAIDQASFDLVNRERGRIDSLLSCNHLPGEDKFAGVWPAIRGGIQMEYGEAIGLGSREYRLLTI